MKFPVNGFEYTEKMNKHKFGNLSGDFSSRKEKINFLERIPSAP